MEETPAGRERKTLTIISDPDTYMNEIAKFGKANPDHNVIKIIEGCQVVQQPEARFNMLTKKMEATGALKTTVLLSTFIVYDVPKKILNNGAKA